MPTNKLIYFGVIVIAASLLLWVGAELAKRVEWMLPYAGAAGVLLVVIGLFMELQKKKTADQPAALGASTEATPAKPVESVPADIS